ncbi:MAG: ATP-binding cassette domain-containing protein [Fusobacteria bacterium]|nr:ATP-binding cassette domain-containing protein [Fusobacteriota bacterium]
MILEVSNLSITLDGITIIEPCSFSVSENDFIGIIGPNGGGKSTLIKAFLGLIPYSGSVNFSIPLSHIGYLPQFNHSIDKRFPITVEEIILSGIEGITPKLTKNEKKNKLTHVLSTFNLTRLKNNSIGTLSGGEIQKTLLARSIISNPKLLILDEPTNFIDHTSEQELYTILKNLNQTMAIMMISHDLAIIPTYIKSILCVNKSVHFHAGNAITPEVLSTYHCPVELIAHGSFPHRVVESHKKES